MKRCFNGLSTVNIELTSRCNKSCWMCGRRKIEKDYPEIANDWGDMDVNILMKIANQLPKEGLVIQFHNNGEPLLYDKLGFALKLFSGHIRCFDTNGKLLLERADTIIDNMETLTVSVIQDDPEADKQYETVKKFLEIKGERKPNIIYRILGDVKDVKRWEELPGIKCYRMLHSPDGSFDYKKRVTIPEIGVCLELLHHLVIDRYGNVSICVRFDPHGYGILGDVYDDKLHDIWTGKKRRDYIKEHIAGNRNCNRLCAKCHYWGVPKG